MFLQNNPEVIAWLRCLLTDKALPPRVGRLESNVNYSEFLRSKGVELPAMVDDRDPMADDSEDSLDKGEDIAEGIVPAQPSTMVANNFEPRAPTDTHGQPRTHIHSHP